MFWIGTLGCFVSIDDATFGLTCYHVVTQGRFQQPSAQIVTARAHFKKEKGKMDMESSSSESEPNHIHSGYDAGEAVYDVCTIKNHKTLDYQLLVLNREIKAPLNEIKIKNMGEDIRLDPLNLNNNDHVFNFVHSILSKFLLNLEPLLNSPRAICIIRVV